MEKRKISRIINATEHPMNLETPVSYTHLDVYKRQGKDGWLEIRFPQLDLQQRVKYADCT